MLKRKTEIGLILAGAFLLCFIAFLNNFPLVYSDTADYLGGAFGGYIPEDRPVFYGLFVRFVSLQSSLWLVVLVQGLLVSYILFETFSIFYSGKKRNLLFISAVAILTATTGISQNTSILLPDIFSPIAILCFINLLVNHKLNKARKAIISLIFVLCLLMHFSNMLIFISIILLIAAYILIKRLKKQPVTLAKKRLVLCCALVASIFIIAPVSNYIFAKKFILSQNSHVFIMAHLVETGILEEYLNNECAEKNYKMCEFKDKIDTNFLWGGKVLWQMGGWGDASKEEFDKIIWDIATTPKYEWLLLKRGVEYTFMEYFTFKIPKNQNWGVPPYITKNYPGYGRDFCASLQSQNQLDQSAINSIQQILVLLGLGVIFYALFSCSYFNALSHELKWLIVLIMVFSFVNAAVCANFGTINIRYQGRIIWLIPLTAFFIIEGWLSTRWTKK